MEKIHFIQHGTDGLGHQLHGLFSALALHNIKHYYFDGYFFLQKKFLFEHLSEEVSSDAKNYLVEIIKKFLEYYEQKPISYKNYIHSHEIYHIPKDFNSKTLYSIDNCYYFDKIPIDEKERIKYQSNIKIVKNFFVNDKLPPSRLYKDNVVIHLRQGDAITTGRGNVISKYNQQLMDIFPKFVNEYKNHVFYIHTDGEAKEFVNILSKEKVKFVVLSKDEHVLNVLSDFVHSKIFVAGISSLSTICTFLGNHEKIIISDDMKHSVPENVVRIKNFLK